MCIHSREELQTQALGQLLPDLVQQGVSVKKLLRQQLGKAGMLGEKGFIH